MEGDGEKGASQMPRLSTNQTVLLPADRTEAMIVKIEGAEQDADREGKPPALCGRAPFVENAALPWPPARFCLPEKTAFRFPGLQPP